MAQRFPDLPTLLKVGTRASPLAKAQAREACLSLDAVLSAGDGGDDSDGGDGAARWELIAMSTTGDRLQAPFLMDAGGKALFVKELEEALLDSRIHLAVHSLKDVPANLPDGLRLEGFPPRGDARDGLAGPEGPVGLDDLPEGARVGTSSLRRRAQLAAMRPDVELLPLRGNVHTRLSKVDGENLHAAVLAMAGLDRLGFQGRAAPLNPVHFPPAPGQGTLVFERKDVEDASLSALLNAASCPTSQAAALAERAFGRALDASCHAPVGAFAHVKDGSIHLVGEALSEDGGIRYRREGTASVEEAERLGRELGEALYTDARAILPAA